MKLRHFSFCLLASVSSPALAQETGSDDGSPGNEIIVIATGQSSAMSASKAETPIIKSPQTISIVNREERSEEHTSELQSLMRISYAVFCSKKKNRSITYTYEYTSLILVTNAV